EMLERQGNIELAISEVQSAVEAFEHLGAAIDLRNAKTYLESLEARPVGLASSEKVEPRALELVAARSRHAFAAGLASAVDGFIAQRLVQASASHDLLLHELVSIVKEQSSSRGAIVAEILNDESLAREALRLRPVASIGLNEAEQAQNIDFIHTLAPEQYQSN